MSATAQRQTCASGEIRRRRRVRAAVAGALLATGCAGDAAAPAEPLRCEIAGDARGPGDAPGATSRLGCARDFELLSAAPDSAIYARTRSLNVMIDREDGDRLYFLNSTRYELHWDFVRAHRAELEGPGRTPVGTHEAFNDLNYVAPGRRFLLGTVVRHLDQDLLLLEMAAGDTADADMTAYLFGRVRDAMHDGDELVYRPVSTVQERVAPDLPPEIPVVTADELFAGQHYQPLNPGTGYGTLRFSSAPELSASPPLPTDIVVLDRVPNDIPVVSGIVTDEFQTPLSHVNILSRNRGTPNMAARGAFRDPDLRSMAGTLVRLRVGPQEFSIEPAAPAEARAWWDGIRPAEPLVPAFDLSAGEIVDLAGASLADIVTVGAKAAQLAELSRVEGVPAPRPALAIPFSFYARHMERAGAWPQMEAVARDWNAGALSHPDLSRRLFALRMRIFRAAMDAGDRAVLIEAIEQRFAGEQVRFRSSTNVEDLEAFSGAGLYTSAGASLVDGPDAVEAAVKTVWASAWNPAAFVERDFYRVDQRAVHMGVLVHRAFPRERANGVAFTLNDFACQRPGFYLNVQAGEVPVANPTGLAVPEQLLYYHWWDEPAIEVIGRSNLTGGEPVLSDDQVLRLGAMLEAAHDSFSKLYPGRDRCTFGIDVEFKIDRDGEPILKQARPVPPRREIEP